MAHVSAVDDDLEFAERSPEPSPEPNPPMLSPFRQPRRPVAPPPPPPAEPTPAPNSGAPRRSLGDLLPRRSLLAPEVTRPLDEEFAKGRDSDERKSEEEPEREKPRDKRDRRPRKKRRSRILSELRPVDGPESALPSVLAIDDDEESDDPLEAPDSGERAKEAFAAQRVRMRKKWCPDLRIYMKNVHPLFGICSAHRHHPYKRGDRFLVLLVALVVALLLCGLFAIRDCCTDVVDVPVAVVGRQLVSSSQNSLKGQTLYLRGSRRTTGVDGTMDETARCLAFYDDCSDAWAVCAQGSTCRSVDANLSAAVQCVPDETPLLKCVAGSCPTGWTCSERTNLCVAASNYMCYLPAAENAEERKAVQLAAGSGGTYTAIEAIFQILQIAANNHEAEMHRHDSSSSSTSKSQEDSAQQSEYLTASPSTSSPPSTSTPPTSSPSHSSSASRASPDSGQSSRSSSSSREGSKSQTSSNSVSSTSSHSASSLTSDSASGSKSSQSSTVKVTLTEPVNGGVYSLSSTILVEWHVTLLSGANPGLDNFRVDFSADNGAFDTIATNVSTPASGSSASSNFSIFQFEWDLADNTSWLCTTCVLRICALDVESASDDNLCIRSDGRAASDASNRRLQTTTTVEGSTSSDVVTFRIVREAFECPCGTSHASFLLAAVIIGACIPVVVLLAEPLVTFYRDRQVFGLFARQNGSVRPVIASYSEKSATRKGRVVLIVLLLALCVACGFVAAQITTTRFLTEKGAIIVLWLVTFAIAVGLGLLVYCTLVCFVMFSVRWCRERDRDRREPSGLSEFRTSLISSDVEANHERITSPGWTVRGSKL